MPMFAGDMMRNDPSGLHSLEYGVTAAVVGSTTSADGAALHADSDRDPLSVKNVSSQIPKMPEVVHRAAHRRRGRDRACIDGVAGPPSHAAAATRTKQNA